MASTNAYASSLRNDRVREDKAVESGVPFFVPHLAKVKTNVICHAKKNQHLLFSFEKDDAAGAGSGAGSPGVVSYRKQGDKRLYSDDNMRKRRELLHNRQILAAITRFWETFPVVRQGAIQIEQFDYVDVFVKLYKALFSVAEAKRIVEKDWIKDVGGDPAVAMTKSVFDHALFEVADIWTVGIGSDEYSSFLTKLYKRVTTTVYDQQKSKWVTVFQELDRIRSFAAVDPRDGSSDTAAAEFANVVTAVMAASASKPPRAPLIKKKSHKSDDPAVASAGSHAATSEQQTPPVTLAGAKQPRRRQDSLLPLSFSSDSGDASTDKYSSRDAISPSGRFSQSNDEGIGHPGTAEEGDTPLTTRSGAAYRSTRGHQQGPMRHSGFGSDEDNDDEVSNDDGSDQDGNNGDSEAPAARTQVSRSIADRQLRRGASTKSAASSRSQSRRRLGALLAKGPAATSPTRLLLPELPTQQIHLSMPNIYLSPDLAESQATERAARRRMRKSAKLAHRLRRITF